LAHFSNENAMIDANLSALKQTKLHQYAIRFLLGGVCTVIAGLVAKRFGPVIGGLFLAFPAIFPAGASLIEAHERENKRKIGTDGTIRGRLAASMDATGAALGCVGLAGFAATVWKLLPGRNAAVVIALSSVVWLGIALCFWNVRRHRVFRNF
jgi:hypothetical protein